MFIVNSEGEKKNKKFKLVNLQKKKKKIINKNNKI
jgi:hypothetical protein